MDGHELTGKLIFVTHLHHKVMNRYLNQMGLHCSQHRLLMHLGEGTYASQAELAKHLEVTPATVAVALKSLE